MGAVLKSGGGRLDSGIDEEKAVAFGDFFCCPLFLFVSFVLVLPSFL